MKMELPVRTFCILPPGPRAPVLLDHDAGNVRAVPSVHLPTTGSFSITLSHEVRITLSRPMSQSAFTIEKQTAFKASLAQAAGVASEAVVIKKIESISSRRHLLVEAICVETSIMALRQAAAEEMAGRLTADSMNRELSKLSCPQPLCSRLLYPLLTHQQLHQNYLSQIQELVPLRRPLLCE